VPIVFAFKRAKIDGVELSATYAQGPLTAWANLAVAKARARTIIGGDGAFAPPTLLAASARLIPLASERPVTASGGLTWRLGKLSLSGDVLASSGAVRTLDPEDPNGSRSHSYAVLGLAAVYHVRIADKPADLRLDLTNLTDARYVTSDADNLEGGWTRRGNGRAISIGIEQGF
jgi:outer membrane receptor protein involved in Fe transport